MKKILIIEDDQIVAGIYKNKFSVEGYQVEVAADGESGLASVHKFRPDAVVLDLMLPKLSGVELMKQVRAEPDFADLPIIVFSNTYLTNMVQDAWKAGATKCLSKASCSPKQLISVVRAAVNGGAADDDLSAADDDLLASAPEQEQTAAPCPSAPEEFNEAEAAEPSPDSHSAFLEALPATVSALRSSLQAAIKERDAAQLHRLDSMCRQAHALTGKAALAGMPLTAQISDAVEALFKELHEKPHNINASTLRTAASAIDLLGTLREDSALAETLRSVPANILVVDDEPISRRAITHALEKAKLKAVSLDNAQAAYDLVCNEKFDLIFLDVDMPGMSGHELCARLRNLQSYKTTPVVFVTGLSDFESRTQSMMSGGNDFIVKPFLFIELAVKALVYVVRSRLKG
jgi:DNA-binding response OmpR family regulator